MRWPSTTRERETWPARERNDTAPQSPQPAPCMRGRRVFGIVGARGGRNSVFTRDTFLAQTGSRPRACLVTVVPLTTTGSAHLSAVEVLKTDANAVRHHTRQNGISRKEGRRWRFLAPPSVGRGLVVVANRSMFSCETLSARVVGRRGSICIYMPACVVMLAAY